MRSLPHFYLLYGTSYYGTTVFLFSQVDVIKFSYIARTFGKRYYICISKSYLTVSHRKTLKFARLLNRYLYLSNNSLKVYFSIGCVKPMKKSK